MILVVLLAVGITAGVGLLVAIPFAISSSLSGSDDENLQLVREVGCVSYANGVLELAKQGYSAEQIQKVYETATTPEADGERVDGAQAGLAIRYCGSPQHVIDSAK